MTTSAEFTPLTLHTARAQSQVASHGRAVLKSRQVQNAGVVVIEPGDHESRTPTVLVHREGEKVTEVEFCCTCGAHSVVQLVYDQE
jgi:hypothetical protein